MGVLLLYNGISRTECHREKPEPLLQPMFYAGRELKLWFLPNGVRRRSDIFRPHDQPAIPISWRIDTPTYS